MVCTRPDIAHAVGVVSRYTNNPGKQHWEVVKWNMRYLRGTTDMSLCFKRGSVELQGYVDADLAGDDDTCRSTTGYVYTVGGAAVPWVSNLQGQVALSTTESEYVAVSEAGKEMAWLKSLLEELGKKQENCALYSDSQSAIHLAKNPAFHSRTKHIPMKYHYIRELVENEVLQLLKIQGSENPADMLTKSVSIKVGVVGSEGVFRFTGIYGVATTANRSTTWNLLRTLAAQVNLTWLIAGDFNEILCLDDKSGDPARSAAQMSRFRQALVDCVNPERPMGRRTTWRFRFEEMWLTHSDCGNIVKKGWMLPSTGGSMAQVGRMIHQTGNLLLNWNEGVFQQRQVEMKLIQTKLAVLMKKAHQDSHFDELKALQVRRASNRRCRNRVKGLVKEDGKWTNEPSEVTDILVRYYEDIFHAESSDPLATDMVLDCIQPRVTESMNAALMAPYSDDEIKRALFQMQPSKSPGPDGMSPCFFQKFWEVVEFDVCKAVREVLNTGLISQESNFTHLVLIPKVKEVKLASDLRPIALCNVVYKIASKVLANRLKQFLPDIISPLQSAFVLGRLISDNTLVATEVAHFMKKLRRQADGFFSLKLDISKAYDRLEWSFLEAMLVKLGFARTWVDVILATVKSVSYSILINGNPTGFILPTRGIRQGDPLSPYLFILCAEGLSALISSSVQNGVLRGLTMSPSAPTIHHLLFADDSFLFGEASARECQAVKNILSIYARASGQKINLEKSSVVFSGNVDLHSQNHLAAILGVKCVKEHGLYLGLPIHVGHNKTAIFAYLKERLTKKLISWRSKILSTGGKELLLKVAAQALPNYVMNCYLLPKSLCDDLQQLCAQFFWGSTDEKRKIHWRSWERMCLPKEQGGLGFKHLYAHNLAMLSKQGWRLLSNPTSLVARVFKVVYYPNDSFLTADLGDRPSYSCTGSWDSVAVHACFTADVAAHILTIPLSIRFGTDKIAWKFDKKGWFSVKSAYKVACSFSIGHIFASPSTGDPFVPLWKALWKAKVPNKVAIFGWRAAHNILPTRVALTAKGYTGEVHCVVCSQAAETLEHLFCNCSIARDIWNAHPFVIPPSNLLWKDWLLTRASSMPSTLFDKLLVQRWNLWRNRNDILWKNHSQSSSCLVANALAWYEEYLQANLCGGPSHGRQQLSKQWEPPVGDVLKLNVDGAYLPQVPYEGTGGVLRNMQGQFVAAFVHRVDYISSPLHAELLAVKQGVQLLQSMHVTSAVRDRK
ncbi:uncharacterized protein LOC133728174 [Rosa rugosa]|uniref:uncharacterized protein LOC133728174 n=1 Tax=Rosa rugosa TaxID=74645 RepID=UPI002B417EFC|nr:uncharacterized protein LOC133728174 [Rosa rugosa]